MGCDDALFTSLLSGVTGKLDEDRGLMAPSTIRSRRLRLTWLMKLGKALLGSYPANCYYWPGELQNDEGLLEDFPAHAQQIASSVGVLTL